MVHLVFNRPTGHMKIYAADGSVWDMIDAAGDAWGVSPQNPWGFQAAMPPGHYKLGTPQSFNPPIESEGDVQIPVVDIDQATLAQLIAAGKASEAGTGVAIGGIAAPIGAIAQFKRDGIMIHGGGSNLGLPAALEPFQPLCKTEGCTRVHNADLDRLTAFVNAHIADNVIVYTAVGVPLSLNQ